MLLIDGVKYHEWTPKSEEEFERIVNEHASEMFGDNSKYIDKKLKLQSLSGIGSIPDGYVITFGDKKVYIAGDTENTPEMKQLRDIDIAFLPMNLPYTMTPEMVADVATAFKPKILYPYHYGDTDTSLLVELMKDSKEIEVRIRKMP